MKKKMPKKRSWLAQSALMKSGAGKHADKRNKRLSTRKQKTDKEVSQSEE